MLDVGMNIQERDVYQKGYEQGRKDEAAKAVVALSEANQKIDTLKAENDRLSRGLVDLRDKAASLLTPQPSLSPR